MPVPSKDRDVAFRPPFRQDNRIARKPHFFSDSGKLRLRGTNGFGKKRRIYKPPVAPHVRAQAVRERIWRQCRHLSFFARQRQLHLLKPYVVEPDGAGRLADAKIDVRGLRYSRVRAGGKLV